MRSGAGSALRIYGRAGPVPKIGAADVGGGRCGEVCWDGSGLLTGNRSPHGPRNRIVAPMAARMRPRFECTIPCPPGEAARRLRSALGRPGAWCRGAVYPGHAVLHVPDAEQRVWSPFLTLDFDGEDGQTWCRGRFGPKPSVWSLFVAAYAFCACLTVFALVFGWAQGALGQAPWAYAVVPAAGLGALGVYGLARWGQHRGDEQMVALRRFFEEAMAATSEGGPYAPASYVGYRRGGEA